MTVATYRVRRGIIMFHLTMPSAGDPVAAMTQATSALLTNLPSIGLATTVELSTRSKGEDAIKWTNEIDAPSVALRLQAYPDLTGAKIRVSLRCLGSDDQVFAIENGLLFWTQLAEPDSPPDEPIEITLSLNTDVYMATSWGDERDNRALAARNAPRFNAFLQAYARDTDATVEDFSADDYPGQVDAAGLVLA
jgi:hypothetical protein